MDRELMNTELIDLINDKHIMLKNVYEQKWNKYCNITITNSEWVILSLIYGKQPTISEISQQVHISRQATHKCIKILNSKGLIVINNVENNNKNKCLKLTTLGEKYYMENELIKKNIEDDITSKIGDENLALLKDLLKKEWN